MQHKRTRNSLPFRASTIQKFAFPRGHMKGINLASAPNIMLSERERIKMEKNEPKKKKKKKQALLLGIGPKRSIVRRPVHKNAHFEHVPNVSGQTSSLNFLRSLAILRCVQSCGCNSSALPSWHMHMIF